MTLPLVQARRVTVAATYATTASVTLNTAATAGNLLVGVVVTDKSAGTFTLPSGYALLTSYVGVSVSAYVVWKKALGGETGLTVNWTTSAVHHHLLLAEYALPAGWNQTPIAVALDSGETTVTTLDFAAQTYATPGLLLGLMGADSVTGNPSSVQPATWAGAGWALVNDVSGHPSTETGVPAFNVSALSQTAAGTVDTAVTLGGAGGAPTADQMWAALVFFPNPAATPGAEWTWNGVPQTGGITVTVKASAAGSVRLRASTSSDLSNPVDSPPVSTDANLLARVALGGLAPDTAYHYGVLIDGVLSGLRGRFRTAPAGAGPFTFASSSCANGNANGVFARIAARAPHVFLHLGDAHYADNNSTAEASQRASYSAAIGSAEQQNLWRMMATSYVWSDHDSAGDNTNRTFAGLPAARAAMQQLSPYTYPTTNGVYHTFSVGRVQFIMTDQRSFMDPIPGSGGSTSPTLTKLGAAQKAWFKQVCLDAKAAGRAIVWGCAEPWGGPGVDGTDGWASYIAERRELADFFQANDLLGRLVILQGDAHMLAYDDGTNTNFASSVPAGQKGPALFANSPLNNLGSTKGLPLSASYADPGNRGQYGHYSVIDNGGSTLTIRGDLYTSGAAGGSGPDVLWQTHTATLTVGAVPVPSLRRYLGRNAWGQIVAADDPDPHIRQGRIGRELHRGRASQSGGRALREFGRYLGGAVPPPPPPPTPPPAQMFTPYVAYPTGRSTTRQRDPALIPWEPSRRITQASINAGTWGPVGTLSDGSQGIVIVNRHFRSDVPGVNALAIDGNLNVTVELRGCSTLGYGLDGYLMGCMVGVGPNADVRFYDHLFLSGKPPAGYNGATPARGITADSAKNIIVDGFEIYGGGGFGLAGWHGGANNVFHIRNGGAYNLDARRVDASGNWRTSGSGQTDITQFFQINGGTGVQNFLLEKFEVISDPLYAGMYEDALSIHAACGAVDNRIIVQDFLVENCLPWDGGAFTASGGTNPRFGTDPAGVVRNHSGGGGLAGDSPVSNATYDTYTGRSTFRRFSVFTSYNYFTGIASGNRNTLEDFVIYGVRAFRSAAPAGYTVLERSFTGIQLIDYSGNSYGPMWGGHVVQRGQVGVFTANTNGTTGSSSYVMQYNEPAPQDGVTGLDTVTALPSPGTILAGLDRIDQLRAERRADIVARGGVLGVRS